MTNRTPAMFDATKPLVMDRPVTLYRTAMERGAALVLVETEDQETPGAVTEDVAQRLWLGGVAVYADDFRPTPVETPQQEADRVIATDDLGGGWYLIRAPWLGSGIKVQGEEAAAQRRAELVAAGPQPIPDAPADDDADKPTPTDSQGGTLPPVLTDYAATEDGSSGWYTINGPGLDAPLRVRGQAAVDAKLAQLRAARDGQPAGSAVAGGDRPEA